MTAAAEFPTRKRCVRKASAAGDCETTMGFGHRRHRSRKGISLGGGGRHRGPRHFRTEEGPVRSLVCPSTVQGQRDRHSGRVIMPLTDQQRVNTTVYYTVHTANRSSLV